MTQVTGAGTGVLKFAQQAYGEHNIVKPTEDGRDAFLERKSDAPPDAPKDPTQETYRQRSARLALRRYS
jgi:hypothetical protein